MSTERNNSPSWPKLGNDSFTVTDETTTIARARAEREADPKERFASEMEATKRHAREFAANQGIFRSGPDGITRQVAASVTVPDLVPAGQIDLPGGIGRTSVAAAKNAGWLDSEGKPTAKLKAIAGDAPAVAPRPTWQSQMSPTLTGAAALHEITQRREARLAADREAKAAAADQQTTQPQATNASSDDTETEAVRTSSAEADAGDDASDNDTESATAGDYSERFEDLNAVLADAFDQRREGDIADLAVVALNEGGLSKSPNFNAALANYASTLEAPSEEVIEAIGEDIGRDAEQADRLITAYAAGVRAEVALATRDVLPVQLRESFEEFLKLRPELARDALSKHFKDSSTAGWVEHAKAFTAALDDVDAEQYEGFHDDGSRVWRDGNRWWFTMPDGRTVDLWAALASGVAKNA